MSDTPSTPPARAPWSLTGKFGIGLVLVWTIFVGLFFLAMVFSLAAQSPQPGQTIAEHHAATGGAYVLLMGCAGGGWFCGFLCIALGVSAVRAMVE